MRYLLDTNIVSDLVRNPHGRITQRIRSVGEGRVCTSIIVAADLRYGSEKKASPRLAAQVNAILGVLEVLPLTLLPTRLMACWVLLLNAAENRSAQTIYLLLRKRFRSVTFL